MKKLPNLFTKKFFFVFLDKNLLPSIGDKVSATNEDTTIEKDKAIAVSLNKVPAIPSIKISGKKTAIRIKVVAIIANVICFEPLNAATKEVSPFSILLYIASVIMTESSVIIPIAKIKLNNTNMFIDNPNRYIPKKDAIRLTGSATAGTITAFRLPKNK